jgi:hypothetical protein
MEPADVAFTKILNAAGIVLDGEATSRETTNMELVDIAFTTKILNAVGEPLHQ